MNWFLVRIVVAFMLLAGSLEAVKAHLFKTCDQLGFCHRQRHYAAAVLTPKYQPRYTLDKELVQVDNAQALVTANVLKSLGSSSVSLPLTLQVLAGGGVRLTIDELARHDAALQQQFPQLNTTRYDGAHTWSFVEGVRPGTMDLAAVSEDAVVVLYGEAEVRLEFAPLKVVVSRLGEEQIVFNGKQLLNVEHYRIDPARNGNLEQAVMAPSDFLPEESNFDAFRDSFKDCRGDTLPFGPESIAADTELVGFTSVYGIPEHADRMRLVDTSSGDPYRMFNVDIFEYEVDLRFPTYGAIPFMVGVKPGHAAGVFWVNAADTWVDVAGAGLSHKYAAADSTVSHWMLEAGLLDVVFFVGPTPQDITSQYSTLTGHSQLPPVFSLGYHQCRWNYYDEADVLEVLAKMDEHKFPYDVIWLDIEYTDDKKYFTWHPNLFPTPEAMMGVLDRTGRKLVAIIDPHLKVGYPVLNEGMNKGVVMKDHNDNPLKGHCWPGRLVWIDTTNPAAWEFWDTLFANGSDFNGHATNLHLWNDMNEPLVFNGPETTAPKDAIHHGGWEHRALHNLYGMTYHEATFHAMQQRNPNQRPFVLTRAFFAGLQRTAAMWTGDTISSWDYLKISLPMVLNQGIAGMPFSGADVGGFFGNPDSELLTRWYQAGVWYPFFRAHGHIDTKRREPWIAGDPYTLIMRDAVRTRYALLPTLYTAFHDASVLGAPVMLPVFYHAPNNTEAYGIEDEFFVGASGLLVKPVTSPGATSTDVYLPDNLVYYRYDTLEVAGTGPSYITVPTPLEYIPVFVRGGSVVVRRDRYRRLTRLMQNDPYTLVVALTPEGQAGGHAYLDDGELYDYQKGDAVELAFSVANGVIESTSKVHSPEGVFCQQQQSVVVERVIVAGWAGEATGTAEVLQNGELWTARVEREGAYAVVKNPRVAVGLAWTIRLPGASA